MLLDRLNALTSSDILSEELMNELHLIKDEFSKAQKIQQVKKIAKSFGIMTDFTDLFKAYEKNAKKGLALSDTCSHVTSFDDQPPLRCGHWNADENGIWIMTEKGVEYACPHPIFVSKILVNAETGIHKAEISFEVRYKWRQVYVDRKVIASRTTIIQLADYGVQVTSENAAALVKFLSVIEAENPEDIYEHISTSRLGWIDNKFMPYEKGVIFDSQQSMLPLFNSITQVGSREKWFECIKALRKTRRMEVLIYLASSLASVLIEPLSALPFIMCLWGDSGRGKTILLKIATSIWADPDDGAYMTDAKATATALEIRLNVLNSLPMMLDDMAQVKSQYDDDFSKLVYLLCAGKGRDRSNKDLSLNKMTCWHNCILTNSERSLITETMQGGAINRIIDVEIGDGQIIDNVNGTIEIIRHNFGHCGREFVEQIQVMGVDAVKSIQKKHYEKIQGYARAHHITKEDKQVLPMSIIMTADEISEQYLFKDDIRLDFEECFDLLKTQGEVSEHKRAYQYLLDTIASNRHHFNVDYDDIRYTELWGDFNEYANKCTFIGREFDKILTSAGFQPRAFLGWAKKHNIIELDARGCPRKAVNIRGIVSRCVILKTDAGDTAFIDVEADDKLPFD